MRAIQITEPKRLEQIEIDEPASPGADEVLVRTHRMGVCGTDISSYLGKFPFFDYPRIPGHELGVEVLEVGDNVTNVQPGDHCSVEPYMNCGTCFACRQGKTNCCETLDVIGIMSDGGLCDRFLIPAPKLHPSSILTLDQLALVETLAIGCHATQRANPQNNDHVLIIGAGPIGLSMLEFTRLTGAQITVMDMAESKLTFCRDQYGIENTVLFKGDESEIEQTRAITGGDHFALVVDATGNTRSMAGAANYVAHTGKLLFLGVTTDEIPLPHPSLHRRELTLLTSRNALPTDFNRCIQLIEEGRIDTAPWITHRTKFDGAVDEFATFTDPKAGVIKAIIDVV
jgi:2-desacetyl-2-hydroxyethyl bacteriochlorophyllide A dehydrogenase